MGHHGSGREPAGQPAWAAHRARRGREKLPKGRAGSELVLPLAIRGPHRLRGMQQAHWVRPRWTRAGTACTAGRYTQVGTGGHRHAQVGTGGHRPGSDGRARPPAVTGARGSGLLIFGPSPGPCAVQTPNPGHLEGRTRRGALPVPSSGPAYQCPGSSGADPSGRTRCLPACGLEGSRGQDSSLRPSPEASWDRHCCPTSHRSRGHRGPLWGTGLARPHPRRGGNVPGGLVPAKASAGHRPVIPLLALEALPRLLPPTSVSAQRAQETPGTARE